MNVEIKSFIQNGVNSLTREQGEKDYRKQLCEDVKEKFDMKSSDFNARVKVAYDLNTATQKRDDMTDVIDEITSLRF